MVAQSPPEIPKARRTKAPSSYLQLCAPLLYGAQVDGSAQPRCPRQRRWLPRRRGVQMDNPPRPEQLGARRPGHYHLPNYGKRHGHREILCCRTNAGALPGRRTSIGRGRFLAAKREGAVATVFGSSRARHMPTECVLAGKNPAATQTHDRGPSLGGASPRWCCCLVGPPTHFPPLL